MNLLTLDNGNININCIDSTKENRFCVLDLDMNDWFYNTPNSYQTFVSPSACLRINNKFFIEIPLHWHILVGDLNSGELEVVTIEEISMFDYDVFCVNPFHSFRPNFFKIEVVNIYTQHSKWFSPVHLPNELLSVVIGDETVIHKVERQTQNITFPVCVFCGDKVNKDYIKLHASDLF